MNILRTIRRGTEALLTPIAFDSTLAILVSFWSWIQCGLGRYKRPLRLRREGGRWLAVSGNLKVYVPHPLTAQPILETTSEPFGVMEGSEELPNVTEGDIVLDVGAGVGRTTITYSNKAGISGLVVAFEINPTTADCLRRNVLLHRKFDNIRIVRRGVWSKRGFLAVDFTRTRGGSSMILGNNAKLDVDSLDNIVRELGLKKVDVITMDIEGAELEAIEGADSVLKTVREIIISAYHIRDGKPTSGRVVKLLEKYNFRLRVTDGNIVCGVKC